MFFPNIAVTLTIEDKLYLESVELVCSYPGDNPEVKAIIEDNFATKTRCNSSGLSNNSKTVGLNETGKKYIKQLVAIFTDLDKKFEYRTSAVAEFKDLLN